MIVENIPLCDKTSYKIGGPARYYCEPQSEDEIVEVYKFAREQTLPVFVLGKGSNLVISDNGLDALVMNLSAKFTNVEWDGPVATAQSGLGLDELAQISTDKGYGGMEELSGIPGTVGGAVVMNAGAFNTEVSHTLMSARVLRVSDLSIETVPACELAFGYRRSAVKDSGDVVLGAEFEFNILPEAASVRKQILERREQKQPLDFPSCGSVFKRPPNNYAGTLIESCGLKGFTLGGAAVSQKHANFIINTGGAKAKDVRGVIRHVQETVFTMTGVVLEPEVIFAGEFKDSLFNIGC